MADIRSDMPLLARNEGIWDGYYRHADAEGNKTDEHESRLICRFPADGPFPYHQTNIYRWGDGQPRHATFRPLIGTVVSGSITS